MDKLRSAKNYYSHVLFGLEGVQRKLNRLATGRFLSGHENAVIPSYPPIDSWVLIQ